MALSRHVALAALFLLCVPGAAFAQAEELAPDKIDILAPIPENEVEVEECARDQEAATISGEIVVCRRFKKESTDGVWNREEWEDSYAARTQGQKPVNTFGIPDHGMVVARGCFIPPCPKPPALFIDVEALPEAPRGSDADRVGRGLAPLGQVTATPVVSEPLRQTRNEELGLPEAPDFASDEDVAASPAGLEEPEARR